MKSARANASSGKVRERRGHTELGKRSMGMGAPSMNQKDGSYEDSHLSQEKKAHKNF